MPTPAKTVRFAAVVSQAGSPVSYLLWSTPDRDPKFAHAVRDHRVMTIHREMRGTHKDHGEVGYHPDRRGQYLLFPKSLRRFEGTRVIGIDYELVADETVSIGTPPKPKPREPEPAGVPRQEEPAAPSSSGSTRENIVEFPASEPPTPIARRAEPKPKAAKARSLPLPGRKGKTRLPPQVAGQIRQAVSELKMGRYVKAYTRLNALLEPRG